MGGDAGPVSDGDVGGSAGRPVPAPVLRPVCDDDLDALFRWQNDPAGIRMAAFTRPDPDDRAAFDAHQARVLADPANRNRAIDLDGVFVGVVASFPMDGDVEVTYWIDPGRWGRGIASAALAAFLRTEEPRRPLAARAAAHNVGSVRVLERTGFVRVGEERSYAAGVGTDVTEYVFRLD